MTKTGFIFMFIFIGLLSLQGQVRKISIINKSSENRNTRLSIPVSHRATASHNAETEESGETALYRDIIRNTHGMKGLAIQLRRKWQTVFRTISACRCATGRDTGSMCRLCIRIQ